MILIDGPWLKDDLGRTLTLRGVNLGGSSKLPRIPDGATHRTEDFFNHQQVSFVGRPFPLVEADEHFSRLRTWGFNFLRLLLTWEAVEHAGPGIYDQSYLDYLHSLVEKAGEHGFDLLIDPHQDAWSRFSGGDGAPGWTFEAAGLDITHFARTGAAIVHQTHGDPFPQMVWPTNVYKLASATMFTLFFAGNDFAPQAAVDGEPVQEYLQRHYLAAMQQVAFCLSDLPNVVGYDTLNEPSSGYVGCRDLSDPGWRLKLGAMPNPYQSMLLGSGFPQEVELWKMGRFSLKKAGTRWMNLEKECAWLPGRDCLWRQHGVWDIDPRGAPRLLRPDYFDRVDGRQVDFNQDYLLPFLGRFARTVRLANPRLLLFFEMEIEHPVPLWRECQGAGFIYAPHWYDALPLVTKHYSRLVAVDNRTSRLVLGASNIRRAFAAHLARFKTTARDRFGGIPVLLGETGVPFDLDGRSAYRSGDFSRQSCALDRSLRAVEDNLLSCTLWNYTSDNTNARGDQWNGEDFSIFSRDQQADPSDPNSGGRALPALLRPYPRKVAGEPLQMSFDYKTRTFKLIFRHNPAVTAPTEVYIPAYQYPRGYRVKVSDGSYEVDAGAQSLSYMHSTSQAIHTIEIYG